MQPMGADQHQDWQGAAASALEWWLDAGVDTLVQDAPHDWLQPPAPLAVASTATVPPATAAPDPVPQPGVLPSDLAAFLDWRVGKEAPDAEWSTARIVASGPAHAEWMVLTDTPEDGDCESGLLLGGAQGRLLQRMLAAIGVDRNAAHVATMCAARPLSGRIPSGMEAEIDRLARHHVALARPSRLLLLGQAAARAVLGNDGATARGRLHRINDDGADCRAVATLHPRFLLDRPSAKAEAWRDLQLFLREPDA